MKELLDNYSATLPKTRPGPYVARAAAFLKWLKGREFNKENVQKWLDYLRYKGYADSTILHDFQIIRRLAIVNGVPWHFKRDEKPEIREFDLYTPALDPADIKEMVECVIGLKPSPILVKPEYTALLALSTVYGLRRVEMVEMEPAFLDLKHQTIFIQTAKKGRQRYQQIPDNIIPYLAAWGFTRRLSPTGVSCIFVELKKMIGLSADQVGWHSIRRSAIAAAYDCGLTEPTIYSYYRWKRPMSNMPMRYATARVVGRTGERMDLGSADKKVDDEVLRNHPFVRFWD